MEHKLMFARGSRDAERKSTSANRELERSL